MNDFKRAVKYFICIGYIKTHCMDYAKSAPLPHELVFAVSVMRNFERNRVSVLPTTQNTMISGSGSIVNIQLPDRALIDLKIGRAHV